MKFICLYTPHPIDMDKQELHYYINGKQVTGNKYAKQITKCFKLNNKPIKTSYKNNGTYKTILEF